MKMIWQSVVAGSLCITGCSAPSDPMIPVAKTVEDRTGHRVIWNRSSSDDAQASAAVDKVLADQLTPESAVQIALLNNHSLQATFEDLGIAQADLVQAGLLRNPIFEAKIKYAEAGGGTALEMNAVTDFLEIFQIPLRRKYAAANLEAAQHRVTSEVLTLAAEVKRDFYEAIAARQALEARRTVAAATAAAADLAQRMRAAGNLSELDLAQNQAMHEQAKLDVAQADIAATEAREKLATAMGLWGERLAKLQLPDRLPDLPPGDPSPGGLESLAMAHRADLQAARSTVNANAVQAGVPLPLLWLEGSELGVTAERDLPHEWVVGPVFAIPIPIFDTGAATMDRRRAELRQAAQRLAALKVQIRSQVRVAAAKLASARQRVGLYRETLLPLRQKVIQQMQLQYNAMQVGLPQLLAAKQEQIRTGMEYVEAVKAYWTARAELEQAVGGKLDDEPQISAATMSTTMPSEPATKPNEQHEHHHH